MQDYSSLPGWVPERSRRIRVAGVGEVHKWYLWKMDKAALSEEMQVASVRYNDKDPDEADEGTQSCFAPLSLVKLILNICRQ